MLHKNISQNPTRPDQCLHTCKHSNGAILHFWINCVIEMHLHCKNHKKKHFFLFYFGCVFLLVKFLFLLLLWTPSTGASRAPDVPQVLFVQPEPICGVIEAYVARDLYNENVRRNNLLIHFLLYLVFCCNKKTVTHILQVQLIKVLYRNHSNIEPHSGPAPLVSLGPLAKHPDWPRLQGFFFVDYTSNIISSLKEVYNCNFCIWL